MAKRRWKQKARQCTGKVRYDHYGAACDALGNDDLMHPYWCSFCGGFHLGHPRTGDPVLLSAKFVQLESMTEGAFDGLSAPPTSPQIRYSTAAAASLRLGHDGGEPVRPQPAPVPAEAALPCEGSAEASPQPNPGQRQGRPVKLRPVSAPPMKVSARARPRRHRPPVLREPGFEIKRAHRSTSLQDKWLEAVHAYIKSQPEYLAELNRRVMAEVFTSPEVLRTPAQPLASLTIPRELWGSVTVGVQHA